MTVVVSFSHRLYQWREFSASVAWWVWWPHTAAVLFLTLSRPPEWKYVICFYMRLSFHYHNTAGLTGAPTLPTMQIRPWVTSLNANDQITCSFLWGFYIFWWSFPLSVWYLQRPGTPADKFSCLVSLYSEHFGFPEPLKRERLWGWWLYLLWLISRSSPVKREI